MWHILLQRRNLACKLFNTLFLLPFIQVLGSMIAFSIRYQLVRLFYDVWPVCLEQVEELDVPVADQRIQLIWGWTSENLGTPGRIQATTLGLPDGCSHLSVFGAQMAFLWSCPQKRFAAAWTSSLLGITFRGEVNDQNVCSQHLGQVGKMRSLYT